MATIRKNGKNFRAQVRRKENGEVVFNRSKTFTTKKEAAAWGRLIEADLDKNGLPKDELTIAELCEEYIRTYQQNDNLSSYDKAMLERIKKWSLAKRVPSSITHKDYLDGWQEVKTERGITAATVMRNVQKLGSVYAHHGIDPKVFAAAKKAAVRSKILSASGKRKRRPTPDELRELTREFLTTGYEWLSDCMWFAIYTCRRQGEIAKLEWCDVDLEKGIGIVRGLKDPRGRDIEEQFPIPPRAVEIIKRQPKDRKKVFGVGGQRIANRHSLVLSHFEHIDDLHFHDYRREGVSRLFENGLNIPDVVKYSLHRKWDTLQRYVKLSLETAPEHVHYDDIRQELGL